MFKNENRNAFKVASKIGKQKKNRIHCLAILATIIFFRFKVFLARKREETLIKKRQTYFRVAFIHIAHTKISIEQ